MRNEIAVAPPGRVEWEEDGEVTTRGMLAITLRRLRRSHTAMVGLIIVCLLLLVALLADVLAPYSPIQTTPHNLWTPGWKHPMGTDLLGRDVLSRIIYGSRVSVYVGVVATLLVVVAFVVLVICGIYIAYRASDSFGLLLGAGVTFLIGLQAFINIGVVTSALPNKGLPLPFISYGGSNLVVMLTGVGLLLSIARRARAAPAAAGAALEPGGNLSPQAS